MATADAETELANSVSWAAALTGSYAVSFLVVGLFISAAALPAIILAPLAQPDASAFVWFTIIGVTLGVLSQDQDEDTAKLVEVMWAEYSEKSPREKKIYLASFFLLIMGGVSFLVGSVGVVAALLTTSAETAVVAVMLAFLYPMIDAWLVQATGWNLATIGGIVALVLLELLAVAYRVSPKIPRDAATSIRSSFNRREAAP